MSMLKQRTIYMGERVPASIVLDEGRLEVRRVNVELLSLQDSDSEEEGSIQVNGTRKRRRLTNLSPEEKMLRRKLKNRMAAQTARDRKKQKMAELEEALAAMEEENRKLLEENQNLKRSTSSLSRENEILKTRLHAPNIQIISSESQQCAVTVQRQNLTQFDALSEVVKVENSVDGEEVVVADVDDSTMTPKAEVVATESWSESTYESAELSDPQQKDSTRTIVSLVTALSLQRIWLAVSLVHLWTCLMGSSVKAALPSTVVTTSSSQTSSSPANNPCLPQWWGSHQKSWNPSKDS